MRSFNTFRDGSFKKLFLLRGSLAGLVALCLTASAAGSDPNRMLSQYVRAIWGPEKGLPSGSISSITQTSDGYLWMGTDRGLIRFDGLTFRTFEQATPNPFPIGPVKSLLGDAQGNLWILLQSTKLLRYHDGRFELSRGEAENGITAICRGPNGAILVWSLAKGVLAYNGKQFQAVFAGPVFEDPVARANGVPPDERNTHLSWSTGVTSHLLAAPTSAVTSMAVANDGKIWLGTENDGLFLLTAERTSAMPFALSHEKITSLLHIQGEELWIGTSNGVVRWTGAEFTRDGVPAELLHAQIISLLRDSDSNIWVGTAHGLIRYNANGLSSLAHDASATSTPVNALFEDREQNLWIAGPGKLERLRDSPFVTFSVGHGLPSDRNGPLYVDATGRTWFAPLDGGLDWVKGNQHGSVTQAGLAGDVVYSISGRENELWVGRQRGGLTVLRTVAGSLVTRTYTRTDGLAENSVYAVHQSRDGTVWAGTLGSGVTAFSNGRFTTYTTADGLSSNTVTSIAESPDGAIWIATPKGLNAFSKGRWRVFAAKDGLPSPDLNCVLADSNGVVWIGSAAGIAFLVFDHVQIPLDLPQALREPVFGIAEDRSGWLWVATANHVLRVKRNELLTAGHSELEFREYGLNDGLLGTEGVKRDRSVVADPLGRIWFSMNRGLSVVDPNRAGGNAVPALVHVESVTVDGDAIDSKSLLRIPSAARRVAFDYAGLSLSDAERVRYRYRLDGFDHRWSEPTSNRTAVYTNMGPGSYRFRVIATNSEGQWSGDGASLDLAIAPAYYQTNWFRALSIAAVLVLLWAIYRIRVGVLEQRHELLQQHQQLLERHQAEITALNEQLMRAQEEERARIAGELHDGVLQQITSLSLALGTAKRQVPLDSQTKEKIAEVQKKLLQVGTDIRQLSHQLHPAVLHDSGLPEALSSYCEEFTKVRGLAITCEADSTVKELSPGAALCLYRIAQEALGNAAKHSKASRVHVRLSRANGRVRLSVSDNGVGFVADQSGQSPGLGLINMRERVRQLDGTLELQSQPGIGTTIRAELPFRPAT